MKYLLITITLFLYLSAFSQNTFGVIIYQEKVNTKPDMQKAEREGWLQWASSVPESMVFQKKLTFNNKTSMYVNIPLVNNEVEESRAIKWTRRKYSNPDNQTYINNEEGIFIEQEDFFGKVFLIEGKPKNIRWKMTSEIKVILNYPCIKATYKDSLEHIEAWFTTEIPVSIGPEKYGQLPGMILELTSKKTKKTLTATNIDFKEISLNDVEKPSKGKKVTREKYRKIVQKKRQEIQENSRRRNR